MDEKLYTLSITYTYRNGNEFTEDYAKPMNVHKLAELVDKARQRVEHESNIVKGKTHIKEVDTAE